MDTDTQRKKQDGAIESALRQELCEVSQWDGRPFIPAGRPEGEVGLYSLHLLG